MLNICAGRVVLSITVKERKADKLEKSKSII